MSKVNEYRDQKAYLHGHFPADYQNGFDAAIDLRIGEKFAEWKENRTMRWLDKYVILHGDSKQYTLTELYDYFIEKIFKP